MTLEETDARIRRLETVVRNLTEARAAQMAALMMFIRILGSKNLLTNEEVSRYCLAALAKYPEELQKGIVGSTLRELSTALADRRGH
jgi:hypothetical protein